MCIDMRACSFLLEGLRVLRDLTTNRFTTLGRDPTMLSGDNRIKSNSKSWDELYCV